VESLWELSISVANHDSESLMTYPIIQESAFAKDPRFSLFFVPFIQQSWWTSPSSRRGTKETTAHQTTGLGSVCAGCSEKEGA